MYELDLGNNERVSRGIFKDANGYTALTFSKSKTFKTLKAATDWMKKQGFDSNGNRIND